MVHVLVQDSLSAAVGLEKGEAGLRLGGVRASRSPHPQFLRILTQPEDYAPCKAGREGLAIAG